MKISFHVRQFCNDCVYEPPPVYYDPAPGGTAVYYWGDSHGLGIGAIVGIVLALVFLIALGLTLWFLLRRRRRARAVAEVGDAMESGCEEPLTQPKPTLLQSINPFRGKFGGGRVKAPRRPKNSSAQRDHREGSLGGDDEDAYSMDERVERREKGDNESNGPK